MQGTVKVLSDSPGLVDWLDNKLTWTKHISELKRGFLNKLNLIKHSHFLPRNSLLDLYFKVILPSVTYALPIWGCCTNKNEFNSLESIHCRGARVIISLPRNIGWGCITPSRLEHIIQRKECKYELLPQHCVIVSTRDSCPQKFEF